MPEPVVIIGPANKPAGPIMEPATDAAVAVAAAADTGIKPEKRVAKAPMFVHGLARAGAGLFGLLAGSFRAVATLGMGIVRLYPRHSLAAGASVLILGAIWYSEFGARKPVPTQIQGGSPASAAKDPHNAAGTQIDVGAGSPAKIASKDTRDPGTAKHEDTATAPTGPAAPNEKPAPAPTLVVKDDAAPSLPSVPDAPAPDLAASSKPEPAPGLAASSKPEPAPGLAASSKPEPAPPTAASLDQSASTLLAAALPDPAPSPPPAAVVNEKAGGDVVKPAPAMEAPAPFGAVTPSPSPLTDVAPVSAPAAELVQLATSLDERNKSAPAPASKPLGQEPAAAQSQPQPAAPVGGSAITETKPNNAFTTPEPKTVQNPPDVPHPNAVAPSIPPLAQPAPTKTDALKSEPPPATPAKVDEPAPVALGSADKPGVAPAVLPMPEPPLTETKAAGTAKPPADRATAQLELPASAPATSTQSAASLPAPAALAPATAPALLDSHVPIADSRSQTAESKPQVPDNKVPENPAPQPTLQAAAPEPRGSIVKPALVEARSRATQDLASAGWVSVPNSGKIVIEDAPDVDAHREDASSRVGAASAATRDIGAHTARSVDFEPESLRPAATPAKEQDGRRSVVGYGADRDLRSRPAPARVEPTAHVVEPNENFWTISRLYYSSGRYYRALWKANAIKYPKIDRLKETDVIVVPAVEDLDPDYIDPPRTTAPESLGTARRPVGRSHGADDGDADGLAQSSASSSDGISGEPNSATRTNRGSTNAVPVRRSSRTDPDLDLPPADAVSRRASDPDHTGRPIHRPLGDDDDSTNDDPQSRTAARPRAITAASRRRPVYKIRPHETLRSIARDMLGDSHRATEILDLNRDLIDDPSRLVVGQLIELPDDARTSVRRSTSAR